MKLLKSIIAFVKIGSFFTFLMYFGDFTAKSQTGVYPATPAFEQMVKDIKADNFIESLKALGLPEKYFSMVKYERINANDKKNIIAEIDYYKYNASTFNDMMQYVVIAVIPKEAFNATYRLPVWVKYQRYEEVQGNWMILNKWKYYSYQTDIAGMVSPPDLKMPGNPEKKLLMENFLKSHVKDERYAWYFKNVLKIQETGVFNKNAQYGVDDSYGLGKYRWRLIMKVDYCEDKDVTGVKEIKTGYSIYTFRSEFENGKYELKDLDGFQDGVSEDEIRKAGLTYGFEEKKNDPPVRMGNLYDNGWEAVYQKNAPFVLSPCSNEDMSRLEQEISTILKSFTFKDDGEKNKLTSYLDKEINLDKAYAEAKERLLRDVNRNELFTFTDLKQTEISTRMEFKDTWKALDGIVPAKGELSIYMKYNIQYDVKVTKFKKEKRDSDETIRFGFDFECKDGKMVIVNVTN